MNDQSDLSPAASVGTFRRCLYRLCVSTVWRLIATVVISVALSIGVFLLTRQPANQLVEQGRTAFQQNRFRDAEQLALRALQRDSSSVAARLLAAQSALSLRKSLIALDHFNAIPDDGSREAVTARTTAGEILLMQMLQLSGAENQFRRAHQQDPDNLFVNERMSYILGLESRSWDSMPYRLAAIRGGQFDRIRLFVLAMGNLALENPAEIQRFHQAQPNDAGVLTGLARIMAHEQRWNDAEQLLRRAISRNRDLLEAQAKLGDVLLHRNAVTDFLRWQTELPSSADLHPGIWAARGKWALEQKQYPIAVRCCYEAIRLDPCDQPSHYRLGQALLGVEREEDARQFLDRSEMLQMYLYHCHMVHIAPVTDNLAELRNAAEAAEALGLLWEAYGWSALAVRQKQTLDWANQTVRRLQPHIAEGSTDSRMSSEAVLTLKIDLSDYPLPERSAAGEDSKSRQQPVNRRLAASFEDQAEDVGLLFTYVSDTTSSADGPVELYEQLGGGVAILDYDADGWPDIYFTQSCEWPFNEDEHSNIDRLYRNRGDGTFVDVTTDAGLDENGFSQGVAAGDFNNDGFVDLYVANIGRNRLFVNNGDGTFSDATDRIPHSESRWSTSCAIADINRDGLPDIYTVNYLAGDDLFTRVCRGPTGGPAPCRIQEFPAAADTLYLNTGEGAFIDVSANTGVDAPLGRGLGLVVADFDSAGRTSLFVANDVSPNQFYENSVSEAGTIPRFRDLALLIGLAASNSGSFEACMGVAAGDANGDGLLDLFVTNFYQESNTLYLQDQGSLFRDATIPANLSDSSMQTLGFGTQFLDGDLDGDLDLIVTNGHINDLSSQGIPYRMPPQYYNNDGRGRFELLSPADVGPFFEERLLGRGLARLDWNRDGRDDAVISHIDSPAALLTNTTPTPGNSVVLHLRGVQSSRDAIGATVTATVGDKTLVRQLTAGDGFHASNQRTITVGLDDSNQIDQLDIHWPSGLNQRFSRLPANREYVLIEGNDNLLRITSEQN